MIGNFVLCISLLIGMRSSGINHSFKETINNKQLSKITATYSGSSSKSIIFAEDFESGAIGWTHYDLIRNNAPMWHTDTFQAYGDSGKSWWSGTQLPDSLNGYSDNWYQALISPEIILPDTGLTLTFKMNRNVEIPSPYLSFDGWDGCNVRISKDGGNIWTVLIPTTPAYSCTSMFAFSWHGEDQYTPGWPGSSSGWVDVSFDLSAYANDTIKIKWVFASDEFSCTEDTSGNGGMPDPSLFGWQIDDINVANVFTNNGEDTTGFTYLTASGLLDFWELTDSSYYSPTHSYHCANGWYDLYDALISPPITIPDSNGTSIFMSYYVYCDLPDINSDGNDYLDDCYDIIVINSVGSWEYLGFDLSYNGSDTGWVRRDSSYAYSDPVRLVDLDLTSYAGQTIQLMWVMYTDEDDDDGIGKGLYIDDISFDMVGVEENNSAAIRKYSLNQVFPNPFYKGTKIQYSIPVATHTTVKVFNLSGEEVTTLVDKKQLPGSYKITWDGTYSNGKRVSAGIYLYKLTTDTFSETKKMVLMK